MAPRDRHLSPEDAELWRYVTRNVSAYRARAKTTATSEEPPRPEEKPARVVVREIPAAPRATPPSALKVGAVADMDRNMAKRLKRGELPVDGRIDLHGLTLDQAHGALTSYLGGAYNRGGRCVVVVTGKGKGAREGGEGKIRRELSHWLNQPALRPLVLAVTEARTHDGGTGAFYVLLKRRR